MLDQVWVFKKNGLVLWSKTLAPINSKSFTGGSIVNHLIRTVLLEERAGASQATIEKHVLKWALVNEAGLVFVLIYNKAVFSNITYVDELLNKFKEDFVSTFGREELRAAVERVDYNERFASLVSEVETRDRHRRAKAAAQRQHRQRASNASSVGSASFSSAMREEEGNGDEDEDGDGQSSTEDEDGAGTDEDNPETEGTGTEEDEEGRRVREKLARLKQLGGGRGGAGMRRARSRRQDSGGSAPSKMLEVASSEPKAKGPKKPTTWHDGTGRMSRSDMDRLDRSMDKDKAVDSEDSAVLQETRNTYLPSEGEMPEWEAQEVADAAEKSSGEAAAGLGFFSKYFNRITGKAELSAEDLDPVLEDMRTTLMGKNVASEIAHQICDSVRTSLLGQKLPSLTRVQTVVREALEKAIARVLTPKRSTDILREIMATKAAGRPYTMVFVGINGVGKSTSLSKVCYYLKSHGLKVMIAACDTFRSGAVEQLKVHARCLEVDLFDKGYHRNPAAVAKDAIAEATKLGYDVVLVDTAGRMQNKEPLMRALAELISDNSPDLTLFVGEALVGNDGIDQLSMFNMALANYSPPGQQHQIDGIILTKFDTVDLKVGAALSMCYKTGQPILFVGTGQKYTHLKKLNVREIINALFQ